MNITNTSFDKPARNKCTYCIEKPQKFEAPWNADRFAEIDMIITPDEWKNTVKDVSAHTEEAINSDHVIVTADIRIKLKKQDKPILNPPLKFHKPTEEQGKCYNRPNRTA